MINKKLIIFTYSYPYDNAEKNFLKYEIDHLIKDFKKIEIIPQKKTHNRKKKIKNFKSN